LKTYSTKAAKKALKLELKVQLSNFLMPKKLIWSTRV